MDKILSVRENTVWPIIDYLKWYFFFLFLILGFILDSPEGWSLQKGPRRDENAQITKKKNVNNINISKVDS